MENNDTLSLDKRTLPMERTWRVASSCLYVVPRTCTRNISVAKATPLEKACLYVQKSRCIVLAAEEGRTGHGTRSAVNYNNYKVAPRKRRLTLN